MSSTPRTTLPADTFRTDAQRYRLVVYGDTVIGTGTYGEALYELAFYGEGEVSGHLMDRYGDRLRADIAPRMVPGPLASGVPGLSASNAALAHLIQSDWKV